MSFERMTITDLVSLMADTMRHLRDLDPFLRMFSIVCFFSIGALSQSPAAMKNSADPYPALRQMIGGSKEEKREALFQIRNLHSETASRIAVPALSDPDEMVRATAAGSIVFLKPAEAAALLRPLLNDKSDFVRREAAYAAGKTGAGLNTDVLVRLAEKDKVNEVRSAAVIALGETGDAGSLDALTGILSKKPNEDNEFLRRSAARAIGQIFQMARTGVTAVNTPQNFLPDKYKQIPDGASVKLQLVIASRSVTALLRVMNNRSESDDTRREAAYALGAIGDNSAISALRANLGSPDPYLTEISKEALLKIEHP
ncbi:MAG: HEAT repeat domain-containing protein [Acidobacteriota bacterium]